MQNETEYVDLAFLLTMQTPSVKTVTLDKDFPHALNELVLLEGKEVPPRNRIVCQECGKGDKNVFWSQLFKVQCWKFLVTAQEQRQLIT